MTTIGCVSVAGCRASLAVLEALAYPRDELMVRLPALRASSGASQLAVLSTCQRTELYATWPGDPDPAALLRALCADRGQSPRAVESAARFYTGDSATRHLLRVAAGLESFVLGETEIAGQVRAAAEASRAAGVGGLELDRLMATAVSASRRAHRQASFAAAGRSVATAAVDAVAARTGGALAGQRVLVVGAGQVATAAVARAHGLGAAVTVCNRTRRHAERFAAAGAKVVDLAELSTCLADTDVAILGTAAPHPLIDAATIQAARAAGAGPVVLVDLCVPRNVDPAVRELDTVRLLDLDDLRAAGSDSAGTLAAEVATAGAVVQAELVRFRRWLAARSAADAVSRLRGDADAIAREEVERLGGRLPADVRGLLEQAVTRAVHRLAHGPTRMLLAASRAGDDGLVELLAGLFGNASAGPVQACADGARPSPTDDVRAAAPFASSGLDAQPRKLRTREQAGDEGGIHAADQLAM